MAWYWKTNSHFTTVYRKLTFLHNKVIEPPCIQEGVQGALHFSPLSDTEMMGALIIFWWSGIRDDILEKIRIESTCRTAGKNLKILSAKTAKKNKKRTRTNRVKNSTRFCPQNSKQKNGGPPNNVAVDHFFKRSKRKFVQKQKPKDETFLENQVNIYALPKTSEADIDAAFRSKPFNEFGTAFSVKLLSGLPYMYTATGPVERSIQTPKSLILAKIGRQSELGRKRKPHFLGDDIYCTYNKKANAFPNALLYKTADGTDEHTQYKTDTTVDLE